MLSRIFFVKTNSCTCQPMQRLIPRVTAWLQNGFGSTSATAITKSPKTWISSSTPMSKPLFAPAVAHNKNMDLTLHHLWWEHALCYNRLPIHSCRRTISATGFTLHRSWHSEQAVDGCDKSDVIWEKHSSFVGTAGLLICMVGGILYQQSTSSLPKAVKEVRSQESEEEQRKLLEMQRITETNDDEKQVADPEDKN